MQRKCLSNVQKENQDKLMITIQIRYYLMYVRSLRFLSSSVNSSLSILIFSFEFSSQLQTIVKLLQIRTGMSGEIVNLPVLLATEPSSIIT